MSLVTGGLSNTALPLLPDAACRDIANPDMFFATSEEDLADARAVCARCPAQTAYDCFTWAITHKEDYGLWANTTSRQRHASIRRQKENR